jgi:formylglycine-generating enzyme required for sulfatase activity
VTKGIDKILQRANIDESGMWHTTPVWLFPLGASPVGVMDLSGNVWEWQANYYDKGRKWFGMRGGSMDSKLDFASRLYFPYFWSNYIGFRVVSVQA